MSKKEKPPTDEMDSTEDSIENSQDTDEKTLAEPKENDGKAPYDGIGEQENDDATSEPERESESDEDETIPDYKVGETSDNGDVIAHIYGKSSELIVFRCDKQLIKWEYCGDNDTLYSAATGEFEALRVSIPVDTPDKIKQSIVHQLALSLYNAINDGDAKKAFEKVNERIASLLTPNQAKLRLILFSLMCTTILGILLLTIYYFWSDPHRLLFATGGAGILGAMFSLLQRNTEVKIPQDNGDFYIFLQALFTCVLGLLSGMFIYLFSKSDFPLAVSGENVYSILIISIIAGFSERLIPDLFDGVRSNDKPNPN